MKIFANPHTRLGLAIGASLLFFAAVLLLAWTMGERGEITRLEVRNSAPSIAYPFGTDWLGRDVLARTIQGLRTSLGIGLSAALASALLALALGVSAATLGRTADTVITWLIDVTIAMPHMVLLILIAFACGGGAKGVIIAVAVTHWPALTRVIRAEVLQVRTAHFVRLSSKFGKSTFFIATRHILPHVLPQFLVGLVLLFPHAILHAAALTFLGFGMSPHTPAIGALLAESMRYLSLGLWWLAVAPGATLVATVMMFDLLGNSLREILNPRISQG